MGNIIELYTLKTMSEADKKRIMQRAQEEIDTIYPQVRKVIDDVRQHGDEALFKYMQEFDGVTLNATTVKVGKEEIKEAYQKIDATLLESLKTLHKQVQRFHDFQKPQEWMTELSPGLLAGQMIVPLDIVGCYSPGGRGWFPSTMFMNACPAVAAGVKRIVMCTPPSKDGKINPGALVAADLAGVQEIYKLSGAQAIAAMAYGTESVPKVLKITGPGSAWVVAAKTLVKNDVGIGVEAGPGEGLVIADEHAYPEYVASDILIQAEHGDDSAGLCVTNSRALAEKVQQLVNIYTAELPEYRRNFVTNSLRKYGAIILVDTMDEAFDFANDYGVEHLEIQTKDPLQDMKKIKNAGGLYIGNYAPLSAGCFCSGPNHTLPTSKAGRIRGGLNTEDFLKKITFEYPTREGLEHLKDAMVSLADYEGFPAHRNAILRRFEVR